MGINGFSKNRINDKNKRSIRISFTHHILTYLIKEDIMSKKDKSKNTRISEADATKSKTHSRPAPKTNPPKERTTSNTSQADKPKSSSNTSKS